MKGFESSIKPTWRYYFDLLWEITRKEITARYKNTIFGFLWVVVNPLIQMFVIGFVFRFFIKEPINNYYLYLLVGLLIWNFFSLSITKATPSIVNERALIKKAPFPKNVIPLSIVISNIIYLIIAFLILCTTLAFGGTLMLSHLPMIFYGMLILCLFTFGFSLLTSALNVRYRDVNFFVQAILIVWFYATPIVYSINVIPYDLMWIWRLNPLTSVVQIFQSVLLSASPPGVGMLISNTLITLLVFVIGVKIFQKESKNFDDWI